MLRTTCRATSGCWTLPAAGRTRFTFDKDVYSPAVWSPDGARIAYSAGRLGDTIYEKAASGLGDEQVLLKEQGCGISRPAGRATVGPALSHRERRTTGYDLWHCRSATASHI